MSTHPFIRFRATISAVLAIALLAFPAFAAEDKTISIEINKGHMIHLSRAASSVVIADPATADVQVVSPKLIFVHGKKIGETSLYAVDSQDKQILDAVIDVTYDISTLKRAVKRIAPDSDVDFKTVDGGLVMDGFAGSVADSDNIRNVASAFMGSTDKMVNMIQTNGSDQVMLKVRIVEMSRTDLKKYGINLQNVISHGNFGFQLLQGNDILFHTDQVGVLAYNNPAAVLSRAGAGTDSNLFLQYKNFSGLVDALEQQGLATTLAEPSLTTTSGKAASFLAGGQFPIPTVQSGNGANSITIQYQPFGVSLNFTPVVMSHDRISLTVAPEVSTLDFNNPVQVSGITYPILDTRKASAVIELGSGDSFMLAGLLKSETTNSINKFPGLGDLPVLGALFRSTQFQNNQTDLVILVTPFVVHPVANARKLQTPIDGYTPPSDLQLILNGDLYQQQPMKDEDKHPSAKADEPQLHGDGGFITQ